MADNHRSVATAPVSQLARFAPGLANLLGYRREWFRHDLVAGLSVAAVAVPVALAYAELAGFPPVVGLYASILPLIAYALFGTSPHLIVNPDAAVCAVVAAIVTRLAAGDVGASLSLSAALALLTGIVCIAAGFLRLGFVADFLGKPVLVGYMNGMAVSIFLGQIGKVFGFPIKSGGIIPRLVEFLSKLPLTHLATLAIGSVTIAVMIGLRRFLPRVPAPLVAVVVAVVLAETLHLDERSVKVVGAVPSGLPPLRVPHFRTENFDVLFGSAVALALVAFSSSMITARSFAARHRLDVDVDREFIALGACNIAAGLSQGFAVTGADSRTAVNDMMGGKSQVSGLIAAGTIAVVLLFLTGPLRYLPIAALGGILIVAAIGLVDLPSLRRLWRVSRQEFAVSMITTWGVIVAGVLVGILVAVCIAILLLLKRASRPPDAVLGRVAGLKGFHNVADYEGAATYSGLVLYRFSAAIVFFNAPYFKKRVLEILAERGDIRWFIVDGSTINFVDSTSGEMLEALAGELALRGIRFGLANFRSGIRATLERTGTLARIGADFVFPSLKSAINAFLASQPGDDARKDGVGSKSKI
jgi:high affinity sulfate transporter 1